MNIFDYGRPVRPALRERLRTHKFSQKEQRFTLIILS